jgi:hypothetical protein
MRGSKGSICKGAEEGRKIIGIYLIPVNHLRRDERDKEITWRK